MIRFNFWTTWRTTEAIAWQWRMHSCSISQPTKMHFKCGLDKWFISGALHAHQLQCAKWMLSIILNIWISLPNQVIIISNGERRNEKLTLLRFARSVNMVLRPSSFRWSYTSLLFRTPFLLVKITIIIIWNFREIKSWEVDDTKLFEKLTASDKQICLELIHYTFYGHTYISNNVIKNMARLFRTMLLNLCLFGN